MREPSPRSSRLAIGGGLLAAVAVGGAGFLLGRSTQPAAPVAAVAGPVAVATPAARATAAVPEAAVMRRGDLIALAQAAADAFASGAAPPASLAEMGGRRFDLVLPFGCAGANDAAAEATTGWRYDAAEGTLRVAAAVTRWPVADWGLDDAGAAGGEGAQVPGVEGFWINRPWSSAEACPARANGAVAPSGTEPVTFPGQTLALADFGATGLARDGRPFETVQRVAATDFDGSRGFLLRVTGRIASGAPGPVRCVQPGGPDQRPICALAATIEEVRIENAAGDAVLATWTVGRTGDGRN